MNLLFDPKLKEAMAEIKAILKKHDIAGEIQLASETHSEYMHWLFEPSWSPLSLVNGGIRTKVQAKTGGENEKRKAEAVVHLALQFRDLAADEFQLHDKLIKELEQHFDIEVGQRQHFPHKPS